MTTHRTTAEEPTLTIVDPPRSVFRRKRFLFSFIPAGLVAVAGVLALFAAGTVALPFQEIVVVRGKLASKAEFFTDEQVRRIPMANGIQVHLTQAGSRAIAGEDITGYDFVFPSGQPAAKLITDQLRRDGKSPQVFRPFFSPIVLATFRDYAEALQAHAGVRPQPGQGAGPPLHYNLPVKGLVDLMRAGKTWRDLGLHNGNRVLAQSPDVCWSNSAGTYLGLVAFVANGDHVPVTDEVALQVADTIKPWLIGQGLASEDTSKNYFAPEGKGLAPLAVIYEHQYLAHQVRVRDQTGAPDRQRVLLYPEAQLQTVPEFIALNGNGEKLGRLITSDPALRKRALELGFRPLDREGSLSTEEIADFLGPRGIPVPQSGVGDTETFLPALPVLEKMISRVGDCPEVAR